MDTTKTPIQTTLDFGFPPLEYTQDKKPTNDTYDETDKNEGNFPTQTSFFY